MLAAMSVEIPPRGTRGVRVPRLPGPVLRLLNGLMFRLYRDRRFRGAHLLSLTTLGARSGQPRRATVACFAEGDDAWLIVASAGGTATHPAWFFNLAKRPDQAWVEVGRRTLKVKAETLKGDERARAWRRITAEAPGFAAYETSTDREIPVIRLTAT